MMMFMRSLPEIASNAKLSGAICMSSVSYGTTDAPALPASWKSARSTVTRRPFKSKENKRR